METPPPSSAYGAIVVSAFAVTIWALYFVVRVVKARARGWALIHPLVFLLVAVGTFASAIGFAEGLGLITIDAISPTTITFISSMGRGALLMGGVFAWILYNPIEYHRLPPNGDAGESTGQGDELPEGVPEEVNDPSSGTTTPVNEDDINEPIGPR